MAPASRFRSKIAKQLEVEILNAALARFNDEGCFRIALDGIAADVGVGKGTLYRHYACRDDLFASALLAGIDTLRARCESVWQSHRTDPDVGFRATVAELVSLNHNREAASPATLARLGCSCQWMSMTAGDVGVLESVLVPFVLHWQAARLVDTAVRPSLIAAVIIALINSVPVVKCIREDSLGGAATLSCPQDSNLCTEVAEQLVGLIQRAFPLVKASASLLADHERTRSVEANL